MKTKLLKKIRKNYTTKVDGIYFEIGKQQHFEFVSKSNQEKQNFQMKLDEAKRQNVKLQNQIIDLKNNTPPNKLNYDSIVKIKDQIELEKVAKIKYFDAMVKLEVKNDKLIIACCVLSVALFFILVCIAI